MKRRFVVAILMNAAVVVASGCDAGHEERVEEWKDFWQAGGSGDAGGSLWGGRRAGETEVWTIECNAYGGPRRREMADKMATALKQVRGFGSQQVWVEHGEEESRLFCGHYRLEYVEAKVDGDSHARGDVTIQLNKEIKRDLKFIRTLALGDRYPFFSAQAVPKPLEDVGPPEWDLRNARGAYTLQVGVTYNTERLHNYKQAAVEWVKALRADGNEAYYYHNPNKARSSICVGTFGDDALVDSGDGRTRYSDAVRALRDQSDFKYNLENGHKIYKRARNSDTGEMERLPNWSFLVKIPEPAKADAGGTEW